MVEKGPAGFFLDLWLALLHDFDIWEFRPFNIFLLPKWVNTKLTVQYIRRSG